MAGFPCQAFSAAGKRLGFEDTRGTLFFEVARIIKEKNPKGFILENVEGLVNHDKGKSKIHFGNLFNRSDLSSAIDVHTENGAIDITVNVIVAYNCKVKNVAEQIQQKVKEDRSEERRVGKEC